MTYQSELCEITHHARGKVWAILMDPATGSSVSIHMGLPRRRAIALTNPRLTEQQRLYEGELGLLIECPWRVESTDVPICSWSDDSVTDPLETGLVEVLLDKTVETLEVTPPAMDLRLRLEGGLLLTVFCDAVASIEDNYSIFTADHVYIVGPRAQVRREPRGGLVRPVLRGV